MSVRMRLLAIDTSESVARWVGVNQHGLLDPTEVVAGKRHDAVLASGVREFLRTNAWPSVDAVAVVTGPGGFTGLRVGVAFATGLAKAWGVPVVPLSLYERLAAMASGGVVWAIVYAGRGEVRYRLMRGGIPPVAIGEVESCPVHDLTPPEGTESVLPLGEGFVKHRQTIETLLGGRLDTAAKRITPSEALGWAAKSAYEAGRLVAPEEVDVDYGADFQPTPKKSG